MKKTVVVIIMLVAVAVALSLVLYNRPVKDITGSDPSFTISAAQLFQDFSSDEQGANELYLDEVVEVKGQVKEINNFQGTKSLLLSTNDTLFGINCSFEDQAALEKVKIKDSIKVKGVCTGMLTDVVLVKCSLEKIDN